MKDLYNIKNKINFLSLQLRSVRLTLVRAVRLRWVAVSFVDVEMTKKTNAKINGMTPLMKKTMTRTRIRSMNIQATKNEPIFLLTFVFFLLLVIYNKIISSKISIPGYQAIVNTILSYF